MHVNNVVDSPKQATGRVWGMYQVHGGYRNAKIGGFKHVDSAVRAIARNGGVGYVMDQHRIVTHAVRHGRIVSVG